MKIGYIPLPPKYISVQRHNRANRMNHKLFYRASRKDYKRHIRQLFSKHVLWNTIAEDSSSFK